MLGWHKVGVDPMVHIWPSKTRMWNGKTRRIDGIVKEALEKDDDRSEEEILEDDLEASRKELEKTKKELEALKVERIKLIELVDERNEEIKRLRCVLDKNTEFLQTTIMELIHKKEEKPSMSPAVAAYLAKKEEENKTKSVKELAKST